MENPLIPYMAIGGTQFGGHISPNHPSSTKQLENTSNVRSRKNSHSPERQMCDIVKEFGYKEPLIQQALEILYAGATSKILAAEDLLEIIYQLEDEVEQQRPATTESIPKYTGEKQDYQHKMKNERNGPSDDAVCCAANFASTNSHTYESATSSKSTCNRNCEATLLECNRVLTELAQNKELEDSRLTINSGEERRSEEDVATYSSSRQGDSEVPKRSTISPGEESTKTHDISHETQKDTENKKVTDEEIFKGGNGASRKKHKKKKKNSKNKENNNAGNTSQVELEESSDNRKPAQSEKKSLVLTSNQEEKKQESVWVDVRPKEPPQHSQVIKNSKTKEDVSKLVEENKKLLAAKFCRMCKTNPANLLLLPCRHLACCVACGDETDYCPVCDTQVIATVKTFMS